MSSRIQVPKTQAIGVQVNKATNQSFTTTSSVVVPFDGAYDFKSDAGMHDTVTDNSRFIATRKGLYRFGLYMSFSPVGSANMNVRIRKNGDTATPEYGQQYPNNTTRVSYTGPLFPLEIGDYLEFYVSLTTGATYTTSRCCALFEYIGTV